MNKSRIEFNLGELMKKVYKGDVTTITQVASGTPVQVTEASEKKGTPEVFIVDSTAPVRADKSKVLVTFYGAKVEYKNSVIVDKDLPVRHLTGRYGKALEERIKDKKENDVANFATPLVLSIGSDPEIFMEDGKGNLMPAFNFLGSKEKPNRVEHSYTNLPIYWDGYQAEFQTVAPGCLQETVYSTYYALRTLLNLARKKEPKAVLSLKTVYQIPFEELQAAKEEHVAFGCSPTFNAYGLVSRPLDGRVVPYRSAGGHIHFGFPKQTEEKIKTIVKTLDAILGVCCVSLLSKYEDPIRREYYGLPGEFRTPPHGLEYRSLSNAWMAHPVIMHLVFDFSRKVVAFGSSDMLNLWDATEEETIETIITNNADKAREIMERNKKIILSIIKTAYPVHSYGPESYKKVYDIFFQGMDSVISDPTDVVKNWQLEGQVGYIQFKEWRNSLKSILEGTKL